MQGPGQQQRAAQPTQSTHEDHVFHQRDLGEAADLIKDLASHEDALVAIGQAQPSHACRITPRQQPVDRAGVIDLLPKGTATTAAAAAPAGRPQLTQRVGTEPTVGVLKQENRPRGERRSGILLGSAARGGNADRRLALCGRDVGRLVLASPVHHDYLCRASFPGRSIAGSNRCPVRSRPE